MITRKTVTFVLMAVVLLYQTGGCAGSLAAGRCNLPDGNSVEAVLNRLGESISSLRSYRSDIEYKTIQPLFESETTRKGVLYYCKADRSSRLRINFQSLKQDQDSEQKYIEQYIFDGVWLVYVNYQSRQVRRFQQADPNRPADAFELAAGRFPLVGFNRPSRLIEQFEVKLSAPAAGQKQDFFQLQMKTRPDSVCKSDYSSIELRIDKETFLPAEVDAVSIEGDVYRLRFLNPHINDKMDEKVFEFKAPAGFTEEIIPLGRQEGL